MQEKMRRKVTYFVQDYEPGREAISKEVEILHKRFISSVFNIRPLSPLSMLNAPKIPFVESGIYHIYTSLADRIFLPLVRGRPLVLTGAAPSLKSRIASMKKHYSKVDMFVVESPQQLKLLKDAGIGKEKMQMIYPGIDLKAFRPYPARENGKFTVLFASAPMSEPQMAARGVDMLVEFASRHPEMDFIFLWRNAGYSALIRMIAYRGIRNITVVNRRVRDVREFYRRSDCTIAPFASEMEKQVPRALVESMACGRPVLASSLVGISGIIRSGGCGTVFEPSLEGMEKAMAGLRKGYMIFSKRSRKTAEKYFSEESFVSSYSRLYSSL